MVLNLGFNWRGLSFSAMFYAPTGVYKLVNTVYSASFKSGKSNAQPDVMNAWTPETANTSGVQSTRFAPDKDDGAFNGTESTYRYQNFSYLRLKTMELGYQSTQEVVEPTRRVEEFASLRHRKQFTHLLGRRRPY